MVNIKGRGLPAVDYGRHLLLECKLGETVQAKPRDTMQFNMQLTVALAAVGCILNGVSGDSMPKFLRGVDPANSALYVPDENGMWKCLGSDVRIPFDRVNDDFCDCPDGSDEPGTSACGHVESLTFYCENQGHIPGRLPSDRVDDGVCDYKICCDGSDEPEGRCPNKCKEIHAAYLKQRAEQERILKQALKTKEKLISRAQLARESQEAQVDQMREESKLLEQQVVMLRAELEQVRQMAESQTEEESSVATVPLEIQEVIDQLIHLETQIKLAAEQAAELSAERAQIDSVLSTLQTDYNPNFNDPAVKGAIKSWQTIRADAKIPIDQGVDLDLFTITKAIAKLGEYRAGAAAGSGSAECAPPRGIWDAVYDMFPSFVQSRLTSLRTWMIDNALLAPRSSNDPLLGSRQQKRQSEAVQKAEKSVQDAEREARSKTEAIERLVADLSANYGEQDVLRALKDTCIENQIGDYTYEFCFNGAATQKGKDMNTNIGSFDTIKSAEDGEGTLLLHYERGQRCWNGPIRRTTVQLSCGEKNALLSVSEPQMCEYFIRAQSPAVCLGTLEKPSKEDL